MHHPIDRILHTTVFVTPVVEHWLEQEIAQRARHEILIWWPIAPWAYILPCSYILLPLLYLTFNIPTFCLTPNNVCAGVSLNIHSFIYSWSHILEERCSYIIEYLRMVRWVIRSTPYGGLIELFPIPASAPQLVYYHVCVMVHIKYSFLLIRKCSPFSGSRGFPFSPFKLSFTMSNTI